MGTPDVSSCGADEGESGLCSAVVELLIADAGGIGTADVLLLTGVNELSTAGMLVNGCCTAGEFEEG